MDAQQSLDSGTTRPYRKLYFIWYFDDEEGYGIEVFGEKPNQDLPRFFTVVHWTFGHGTWARDLRRKWGDFAADWVAASHGIMPPEMEHLVLHYNVQTQVLEGDVAKIESWLHLHE